MVEQVSNFLVHNAKKEEEAFHLVLLIIIIIIIISVLPKGWSFTANSVTKTAILLEGRFSTANLGTQAGAVVLVGMDRCGSFPLLSASHSL